MIDDIHKKVKLMEKQYVDRKMFCNRLVIFHDLSNFKPKQLVKKGLMLQVHKT